jgi:hypothetical protein
MKLKILINKGIFTFKHKNINYFNFKLRYGVPKTCNTREWNSRHNIHMWQEDNMHHIKRLAIDPVASQYLKGNESNEDVTNIINDNVFWSNLKSMNHDLCRLQSTLNILQADDRNLADSFYYFDKLATNFAKDNIDIESIINEKWDLISHDCFAAVYFVDVRSLNEIYKQEHLEDAMRYYNKYFGNKWTIYKSQFEDFRAGVGPFSDSLWKSYSFRNSSVDALKPWLLIRKNDLYGDFANECIKLCSTVTGIGGLERTFSSIRRIHTWKRSRLSKQTLDDMVYIYVNYKFLKADLLKAMGIIDSLELRLEDFQYQNYDIGCYDSYSE